MNPITSLTTEQLKKLMKNKLPLNAKDVHPNKLSTYQLIIYTEYCRRNMLQNPQSCTYPAAIEHEILPVVLDRMWENLSYIIKVNIECDIREL